MLDLKLDRSAIAAAFASLMPGFAPTDEQILDTERLLAYANSKLKKSTGNDKLLKAEAKRARKAHKRLLDAQAQK